MASSTSAIVQLVQRVVLAEEPAQKVFGVKTPGLNGHFGETLLYAHVISEFFDERTIWRRCLRLESQTPNEMKPTDRT